MGEVPLYLKRKLAEVCPGLALEHCWLRHACRAKGVPRSEDPPPTPLGPPEDPGHRPTVGSLGGAFSQVRYPCRPRAGTFLTEARLACQVLVEQGGANTHYRATSLIRERTPPGPYRGISAIRNQVLQHRSVPVFLN